MLIEAFSRISLDEHSGKMETKQGWNPNGTRITFALAEFGIATDYRVAEWGGRLLPLLMPASGTATYPHSAQSAASAASAEITITIHG